VGFQLKRRKDREAKFDHTSKIPLLKPEI
jgi:hypothetical protein